MKSFKIKSIEMENFKTFKDFTSIDLDADLVTIYGESAIGKSTILDAFSWVLTGKDYKGNANFEYQSIGTEDFEETLAKIDIEVTEGTSVTNLTIGRSYIKKTKKKSHPNTVCTINGVEFGANNFKNEISNLLAHPDQILYLANPFAFLSKSTTDKKKELLKIFDNYGYKEIVKDHPEYETIGKYVKTTDSLSAVKRTINKKITDAEERLESYTLKLRNAKSSLKKMEYNGNSDLLLAEKEQLKSKLSEVNQINRNYDDAERKVDSIRSTIASFNKKQVGLNESIHNEINHLKSVIEREELKRTTLVDESNQKLATLKTKCSVCGQDLPEGDIQEMQDRTTAHYQGLIEEQDDLIDAYKNRLEKLESTNVEDMEEYKANKESIEAFEEDLEDALQEYKTSERVDYGEITDRMSEIDDALGSIYEYEDLTEKVDMYKIELDKARQDLRTYNNELDLVVAYLNLKLNSLSDRINGISDRVRIQLFDKTADGEDIKDAFNIFFTNKDNVEIPDTNCSGGEEIALGSELLKLIEKDANLKVPLIVDKAESTTLTLREDTQVIKTVVTPNVHDIMIDYMFKDGRVITKKVIK